MAMPFLPMHGVPVLLPPGAEAFAGVFSPPSVSYIDLDAAAAAAPATRPVLDYGDL